MANTVTAAVWHSTNNFVTYECAVCKLDIWMRWQIALKCLPLANLGVIIVFYELCCGVICIRHRSLSHWRCHVHEFNKWVFVQHSDIVRYFLAIVIFHCARTIASHLSDWKFSKGIVRLKWVAKLVAAWKRLKITNVHMCDPLSLHRVWKWLCICENEAIIAYHYGPAAKLRNICRRSLTQRLVDLASYFRVSAWSSICRKPEFSKDILRWPWNEAYITIRWDTARWCTRNSGKERYSLFLRFYLRIDTNLLLLGQATICWQLYNPVPSHTEMHKRSIFPLLWLFLSFEISFSTLRPLSD